jgi:hypothetical protein
MRRATASLSYLVYDMYVDNSIFVNIVAIEPEAPPMTVRTTIHLDERVLERLGPFVGPRGLSRFINQAMTEKLAALERQRLEADMREGYLASRADRAELNVDWSVVDVEGWTE